MVFHSHMAWYTPDKLLNMLQTPEETNLMYTKYKLECTYRG